jgi:hypothetical protein
MVPLLPNARSCQACGQCIVSHQLVEKEQNVRRRSSRIETRSTTSSKSIQVIDPFPEQDNPANSSISSSNDSLCQDCIRAMELMVEQDCFGNSDEEDSFKLTTPAFAIAAPDARATMPFVSPEAKKFRSPEEVAQQGKTSSPLRTTGVTRTYQTNICQDCEAWPVPEPFMKYCTRCYTKRNKVGGSKLNESTTSPLQNNEQSIKTASNRCRLCTGKLSVQSHEYCLKCFSAKKRDDSRRYEKQLRVSQNAKSKNPPPTAQHIPYECMDCGGEIRDCSWKTKCPRCFVFNRGPKRPKLLSKEKILPWR